VPLGSSFRKFFAKIGKIQFSLASAQDALGKISKIRFTRRAVDNVIGVTGELLMTAGVFVLLFLGWHVWYNDIVSGIAQDNA
jgi:hypothetical protein